MTNLSIGEVDVNSALSSKPQSDWVWFMCKYCKICGQNKEKILHHIRTEHEVELSKDGFKPNPANSTSAHSEPIQEEPPQEDYNSTSSDETSSPTVADNQNRSCDRVLRKRKPKVPEDKNNNLGEIITPEQRRNGRKRTLTRSSRTFRKPTNGPSVRMNSRKKVNKAAKRIQGRRPGERVKPGISVEGNYVCKYCRACFTSNDKLQTHKRIHTGEKPYKCRFCKKGFAQVTNRNNHERIHTGERPYVCKTCNKGFTQVTNLMFHERIHTGEKPYKCKICKIGFAQIANFNSHNASHHK